MGCANTKKRIQQVSQQQSAETKEEKFHDFGLKKQDSFQMFDQQNPRGLISQHMKKRNVQRSFSYIKSMPAIDIETVNNNPSTKGGAISRKRSSMNGQFASTPNIDASSSKEGTAAKVYA